MGQAPGHRNDPANVSFFARDDPNGIQYKAQPPENLVGATLQTAARAYTIVQQLGVGATSVAYQVKTGDSDHLVAKILRPRDWLLDRTGRLRDPDLIRRFKLQWAGRQLEHENLLRVVDYGHGEIHTNAQGLRWETPPFLITEFADGGTLSSRMGSANDEDKPRWTASILGGLEFLHGERVLHRDIKPDNIFFLGEVLKIGDIGVARWTPQLLDQADVPSTVTGAVLGTNKYLPPKQVSMQSPWHDMFSFGATLAEIWGFRWGRDPFARHMSTPKFTQFLSEDVPPGIADLIRRSINTGWNRFFDARDAARAYHGYELRG